MYDVRPDQVGWTVYDAETGRPAVLDDLTLVGLEHAAADETAALLNRSVYGARQKPLSRWPLMPSVARRDAGKPLTRR
jgi:hypothetical protein